jgi:MFS family permease
MMGDYFGRKNFGTIVGLTSTISAISGAIGPIFVGLSFDITGSYRFPFLFLGITVAIAIPLILSLQSIKTVKEILSS